MAGRSDMRPQRVISVMLLLLSCTTAMLTHREEAGDGGGGMDQIPKPDRPKPDQTDGEKDGPRGKEQEDKRLTPLLQPLRLDDAATTVDQNDTSRHDPEPEPVPKTPSWSGPCLGLVEDREGIQRDRLNALLEGWGQGSELKQAHFTRFGLCSDPDANAGGLNSMLSTLANSVAKDRGGLHLLDPTKELWVVDAEHQKRELTLHFLLPPPLHSQLSRLTPMLVFALADSTSTAEMRLSFTSQSLVPHQQAVCISAGTRYAVLNGRQMKDHAHSRMVLRIVVEINQAEQGEKRNLQDLLTGERTGPNGTQGPLLLLKTGRMLDSPDSPSIGLTAEMSTSTSALAPSRTFVFLSILQKFLSEAFSAEQLPSVPAQAASVSLDDLQSLPPLTLGVSSSESLLLGLLNSTSPTMFSFPPLATELLEHRVELDLQPPLVDMLRLWLEEAMSRMVQGTTGRCGLRDRLQRLQELSSLTGEGEEAPADMKNNREAQYRALLLFKALQTVLGAWEEERGLRSARGGQDEGSGRAGACRLQPLSVSLKNYVLNPDTADINNCEGSCSFPLTEANNHVILLNSHAESGRGLGRPPCCVPLEYEDLLVMDLAGTGTVITMKPNMVAKKCGCR